MIQLLLLCVGLFAASPSLDLFHGNTFIADLHADTLYQLSLQHRPNFTHGPTDLSKQTIIGSGLKAQFFSIWVPTKVVQRHRAHAFALRLLAIFDRLVRQNPGWLVQARTTAEIEAAHRTGRFAALLGLEGAEPLGQSASALIAYHQRGVRYVALTWNRSNAFGDPAVGPKRNGGITAEGIRLVRLANKLGVMLDVSHASKATFWGILRHNMTSTIASHSNAWAVCEHARNLDDEQLKAIARSGGVIGINFYTRYLNNSKHASSSDVVAHIRYIADLVGINHLALGSDFDGSIVKPSDLRNPKELRNLTQALLIAGFSLQKIGKIYGANLLRTMRQVEQKRQAPPARIPLTVRLSGNHSKPSCAPRMIDRNRLTACRGDTAAPQPVQVTIDAQPTSMGIIAAMLVPKTLAADNGIARLRQIRLQLSCAGQQWAKTLTLRDTHRMQVFSLPNLSAGRCRSYNAAVTPLAFHGGKFKQYAIAEIVFYSGPPIR